MAGAGAGFGFGFGAAVVAAVAATAVVVVDSVADVEVSGAAVVVVTRDAADLCLSWPPLHPATSAAATPRMAMVRMVKSVTRPPVH